jgi:hypothetical protein
MERWARWKLMMSVVPWADLHLPHHLAQDPSSSVFWVLLPAGSCASSLFLPKPIPTQFQLLDLLKEKELKK